MKTHTINLLLSWFLPPANVVCEGYVFTGVCLSTRGGSPSRGVLHPGGVLHLGGFSIPWGVLHPRGGSPSQGGSPSRGGSPSGQCVGGTHHTGMHSCCLQISVSFIWKYDINVLSATNFHTKHQTENTVQKTCLETWNSVDILIQLLTYSRVRRRKLCNNVRHESRICIRSDRLSLLPWTVETITTSQPVSTRFPWMECMRSSST